MITTDQQDEAWNKAHDEFTFEDWLAALDDPEQYRRILRDIQGIVEDHVTIERCPAFIIDIIRIFSRSQDREAIRYADANWEDYINDVD